MSSITAASPRRLEDLHREIDSYASLITKDFLVHGREFPDGIIRFSIEVTEIFRSYLPEDERGVMRWTFYFNTRPDIRQIAINGAFARIYPTPAASQLPILTPRLLSANKTPSLQIRSRTSTEATSLPQLSRPSSSKAGHFTSIPERE
jgi:hypothetical protein